MKKLYSKKLGGEAFALDAAQLDILKKAGYTVPSPEEVIADAAAVKIEPPEGARAYVVFEFKTGAFAVRTRTQTLPDNEVGGFDFILADLGVSSMQIDNPKRGFSFKVDGPLDLRLNQETGISAAERLDTITREELAGMLYENSDEPYCEELAKAITDEIRRGSHIDTTTKLRRVIEDTLDFLPEKEKKDTIKKTCQRTFQALRIDVNQEFEVLYEFMEKLPGALRPGGRVAILTFHSGEDKLVKQALKEGYKSGIYSDYAKDVIRPSAQECAANGRARSTKMRWAVKA